MRISYKSERELLAVGLFGHSRPGERVEALLRCGRNFSTRTSRGRVVTSAAALAAFTAAISLTPRWIAFAQQTPAARQTPAFEVISVKHNTSNAQTNWGRPVGDRFTAVNTNLKELVALAWKLRTFEVFNAPSWIDSERYDITARASQPNITDENFRLMLQGLLADRFKLTAHRETREETVYALAPAKGGIKAPEAKEGACAPFTPGQPQPPRQPGQPEPPPPCGALNVYPNHLAGYRINTAFLIRGLSELLSRPVLDQTGYAKAFDFNLEFKMEGIAPWEPGGFGRPELSAGTDDGSLPTIFTALQEKLGFTLRTQKAPVEVLVVDHIERPMEN